MTTPENKLSEILRSIRREPLSILDCSITDLPYHKKLAFRFGEQFCRDSAIKEIVIYNICVDLYDINSRLDSSSYSEISAPDIKYELRESNLSCVEVAEILREYSYYDFSDYLLTEDQEYLIKDHESISYATLASMLAEAVSATFNHIDALCRCDLAYMTDKQWLRLLDMDEYDDYEDFINSVRSVFTRVSSNRFGEND